MKAENADTLNPSAQGSVARRDFIKASLAGAAGATLALSAKKSFAMNGAASAKTPNILYIHSHDTGRYTSPYGYDVPTPNLRKLAEEGILFREAYCAAPLARPAAPAC